MLTYDTNIVCTYNTAEVFLETDNVTDKEKEFIRDVIYRQEFLNILMLEEFDEKKINNIIDELYEKIKHNEEMSMCMVQLMNTFSLPDEKFGLLLLLSYDYLHLTHVCICELLTNSSISKNNIEKLKLMIF